MSKNRESGFSVIHILLLLIITGIVGFTGWYVINGQQTPNSPAAQQDQPDKNLVLDKSYTDEYGEFSVRYPSSWKIIADEIRFVAPNNQASQATLTSQGGTVLTLKADMGGWGGVCSPTSTDEPFQDNNNCPTREYLSREETSIKNVYKSVEHENSNHFNSYTYEPTEVVIVSMHYADPKGKDIYMVGLTDINDDNPLTLHKPLMGYYRPEVWITNFKPKKGGLRPYIYAYASSNSKSFLTSYDAEVVKAILKSMKISP